MNIRTLQRKVKALTKLLPPPAIYTTIEQWARIRGLFAEMSLCAACRARVDQALQETATVQPRYPGGYTYVQTYYDLQTPLVKALGEGCLAASDYTDTCKVRLAEALDRLER